MGLVLGGAGVASGIAGAVTGILALGKNSSARHLCPNAGACGSQAAVDDSSSAQTFGTVSTVTVIAGAALFAGGLVTYLLAPRRPSASSASASTSMTQSLTAGPLVGQGRGGLVIAGHF